MKTINFITFSILISSLCFAQDNTNSFQKKFKVGINSISGDSATGLQTKLEVDLISKDRKSYIGGELSRANFKNTDLYKTILNGGFRVFKVKNNIYGQEVTEGTLYAVVSPFAVRDTLILRNATGFGQDIGAQYFTSDNNFEGKVTFSPFGALEAIAFADDGKGIDIDLKGITRVEFDWKLSDNIGLLWNVASTASNKNEYNYGSINVEGEYYLNSLLPKLSGQVKGDIIAFVSFNAENLKENSDFIVTTPRSSSKTESRSIKTIGGGIKVLWR